jgi:hypothetical protein
MPSEAKEKENATYQQEIDNQNTKLRENSRLDLSGVTDKNDDNNEINNINDNKFEGIKLLKWANIIQITWFSLFVFRFVFFNDVSLFAEFLGLFFLISVFLFLPLNFIYLVIQYKKLLLLGNSKIVVLGNICSSPLIIFIIILSNKIWWQFEDNSALRNFFYLLSYTGGFVLLGLVEISFGIGTLLKIKKIEAN